MIHYLLLNTNAIQYYLWSSTCMYTVLWYCDMSVNFIIKTHYSYVLERSWTHWFLPYVIINSDNFSIKKSHVPIMRVIPQISITVWTYKKKYRNNDRVWSFDLFFDIKSAHESQFCFQIFMISTEKSGPVKIEPSDP